jgi:hypothetical protein
MATYSGSGSSGKRQASPKPVRGTSLDVHKLGSARAACEEIVMIVNMPAGNWGGCPVSEILVTLVFDRHCHVDGVLRGILGNIDGIWLSWEVEFVDDFLGGQVHDRELAGDVDIVQGGIYAHDGYRRR